MIDLFRPVQPCVFSVVIFLAPSEFSLNRLQLGKYAEYVVRIKAAIDRWNSAASITSGHLFSPVNKGDRVSGEQMTPQAVYNTVATYAAEMGLTLAPHDMRRTFAQLARKADAPIEQIQLTLGHTSIQTTERYLGTKQDLTDAPSDRLKLRV